MFKRLSQTLKATLAIFLGVLSSGIVQLYQAPTALAATEATTTIRSTSATTGDYYLETAYNNETCGQATITLRNVTPWMYRVLIETQTADGSWTRVAADTGNQWMVVPGVMEVNNLGDAPDNQTGTYTVRFAEDSGTHNVRYRVSSGTEADLYAGQAIGTFNTFAVNSNCQPDPETVTQVTICHRTNSNTAPYTSNTVSIDGSGVDGGLGDHAAIHTGPAWSPTLKDNHENWGDIIPPYYYRDANGNIQYFAGSANWNDADAQLIYQNGCSITGLVNIASTATATVVPCVANTDSKGSLTLTVTNTNDLSDYTGTYVVTINGIAQPTFTLADGATTTKTYENLVGTGRVTVVETLNGVTTTLYDQTHNFGVCSVQGVTSVAIPAAPAVNDPCDLNNATWNIPTDTDELVWYVNEENELVVEIVAENTTFPDGTTVHNYGTAVDSNVLCPVTPPVLSTSSTTPAPAALLPAVLPATGSSNNPFLIIMAALATYGAVYFAQGRRRLNEN